VSNWGVDLRAGDVDVALRIQSEKAADAADGGEQFSAGDVD
jgi:hypothetical protein